MNNPYLKKLLIFYTGLFLIFTYIIFGLYNTVYKKDTVLLSKTKPKTAEVQSNDKINQSGDVLGSWYDKPRIYISGTSDYAFGGVITQTTSNEPSVEIDGYKIEGNISVAVYKADEEALLNYLTYDDKNKQIQKTVDTSSFEYVATVSQELKGNNQKSASVLLPIENSGIWYLKVTQGKITVDSFLVRSSIAILVKEGEGEYIYWGQNVQTGKSISEGNITLYNLENEKKELLSLGIGADGIAKSTFLSDADVAIVTHKQEKFLVPINLHYLNSGYNYRAFKENKRKIRYFIYTDRPLYKPGDKMYFKAILRDDNDAKYSVSSGTALVQIYQDGGLNEENLLSEQNYPIDEYGTVKGEYNLDKNAKVGYYTLQISVPDTIASSDMEYYYYDGNVSTAISFQVQHFRKPEYFIDVDTQNKEYITGEEAVFTVQGQYFSGQPMTDISVEYTISSSNYYEYEYIADIEKYLDDWYRWGYWGGNSIKRGDVELNSDGFGEIIFDTKQLPGEGKTQIVSVVIEYTDKFGQHSFSKKNILVYAGDFGIYRTTYGYWGDLGKPYTLELKLIPHRKINLSNVKVKADVEYEHWVRVKDTKTNIDSYKKIEKNLPSITTTSYEGGKADITFNPDAPGRYTINVEAVDKEGNSVRNTYSTYIYTNNNNYYYSSNESEVKVRADKEKYKPDEDVILTILADKPGKDVFLTFERGYVHRYQIVSLEDTLKSITLPLQNTDIPNIFASASIFSKDTLQEGQAKIIVLSDSKKLKVTLTPDRKKYGPSDTVVLNVVSEDLQGNPVSADVGVWAVDKALYELADKNYSDIFEKYWKERSNTTESSHSLQGISVYQAEMGGGCFSSDTEILLADKKIKKISQIKKGDKILTRTSDKNKNLVEAEVQSVHKAEVNGYLIINRNLKITPNHILYVNGSFREASLIQVGDKLLRFDNKEEIVNSIEYVRGIFDVYNLEVKKYNTFFAGGIWVHNQKGEARTVFEDTAYWNPSVHTDSSGRAQVTFKLPDNLTTWVLAGIGASTDTKVGEATAEIVVSKNVIVRPILPNILRAGDKIIISALIQNFTDEKQTFDITAKFDAGKIEQESYPSVEIESKKTKQIYWQIYPSSPKDNATLTFSAHSRENKTDYDVIQQKIPVRAAGFYQTISKTGSGNANFDVSLSDEAENEQTNITLSLSSSIISTLPTAVKYLLDYPYGCIEQTTSRFVPLVIAKNNPQLFSDVLVGKDVDDMIKTGISKLVNHQTSNGGWQWWGASDKSNIFLSAYVTEYLLKAKELGYSVDATMLKSAQEYAKQYKADTNEEKVAKHYMMSFFDNTIEPIDIERFKLTPDMVAMAAMSNMRVGNTNIQTNGITKLLNLAKKEGDKTYWEEGGKENFGSNDASTALALRAILQSGGSSDFVLPAVQYLISHRKMYYWSNTYATSQVIRAVSEYSAVSTELQPNYTYKVLLNDKRIAQGKITDYKQKIKDVVIDYFDVANRGSSLKVDKEGEGSLYSTLIINEFNTDKDAKAVDNGITIKREYVNEKGPQFNISVGDTVAVRLTINKTGSDEFYGVIEDELPSGLIPINPTLKNEKKPDDSNYYYSNYGRDITENGMILSLYQLQGGEHYYTYYARAISQGEFYTPPAKVSLMYSSEVNGRTKVEKVTVSGVSKFIKTPESKASLKKEKSQIIIYIFLAIIFIIAFIEFIKVLGVHRFSILKDKMKKVTDRIKQIKPPQKEPSVVPPQNQPITQSQNAEQNNDTNQTTV